MNGAAHWFPWTVGLDHDLFMGSVVRYESYRQHDFLASQKGSQFVEGISGIFTLIVNHVPNAAN